MPIAFTRYIDITSGVGAGAAVATRELIARLFTTNELVPTGTIIEFDTPDGVGDYFGFDSEEYKRSVQCFGWISKNITRAKKISFASWNGGVATAPKIFGKTNTYNVSDFTGINDGAFTLTMGAETNDVTGIDFSAAVSLNDVATAIQTQIQAASADPLWTGATVVFNATRGSFDLVGGATGEAPISVAIAGVGTNILDLIGWDATAIYSDGSDAETSLSAVQESTSFNNNFGSFAFQTQLPNSDIQSIAQWNDAQNNRYQYHVPVVSSNAVALQALLDGISGVGLTLDPGVEDQYPEMIPMTILAATDYTKRGAAQNYMYQQFPGIASSVTTDADADVYDPLRVNYYGETQTAGQFIAFYQQGFLQGGSQDAIDMGVYANEQWLKDALGAVIMEAFLNLPQIPAAQSGEEIVLAVAQGVIDQALINGTILVEKDFTNVQKVFITQITGDDLAWQQVQHEGYWIDAEVQSYVEDSITKFKIDYTLIYGKGDSVRKVEGRDILI